MGAPEDSLSWKARYPYLAKALSLKPHESTPLDAKAQVEFDDAIAKHAAEAAKAAGFGDDGVGFIPTGRNNTPRPWNSVTDPPEKIPRIIHQTWKEKTLPPKWQAVRDECARMHPDYDYMLWTDADSRQFLVENYSWFVPIFDAYPYPIQRADAIRYFILHKFGGIYMDLDVGCLRRFDPLLRFEVVLPKTIPVGVSNDVMASAKGHPFMDHLIHNLVTFNHRYLTHYPTVMFSTGPMFVSAAYGLYVDAHGLVTPSTPSNPSAGFSGIRILPKALYGKNAKPSEAPDAFFRHFYGSSWHAGDAGFLIFLREHGRFLIFIGFCVLLYGVGRSVVPRLLLALEDRSDRRRRSSSRRRGRWISLPFVRDPRSGQYRSLPRDIYADPVSKSFLDEGTQTNMSPISAVGAAESLALSERMPHTRVAAPRPQRAGGPLFELAEGENSNGEDDIDLGPGLNAERMKDSSSSGGILNWMSMQKVVSSGSGSRPQSSASIAMSSDIGSPSGGAEGLGRSGSASKFKEKASSILYLPAFLVGGASSTASTDSTLASIRTTDDENIQSPTDSTASTGTPVLPPPWKLTRPHARSSSNIAGSSFGNWAASFLNGNGSGSSSASGSPEVSGRGAQQASALQKMWGGVSLAARTPSPSMFLGGSFGRRRSDEREAHDLESTGDPQDGFLAGAAKGAPNMSKSSSAMSHSSIRSGDANSSLRRSPSSSQLAKETGGLTMEGPKADDDVVIPVDDVPPPYDYVSGAVRSTQQGGDSTDAEEQTPTLGARRMLGRR